MTTYNRNIKQSSTNIKLKDTGHLKNQLIDGNSTYKAN